MIRESLRVRNNVHDSQINAMLYVYKPYTRHKYYNPVSGKLIKQNEIKEKISYYYNGRLDKNASYSIAVNRTNNSKYYQNEKKYYFFNKKDTAKIVFIDSSTIYPIFEYTSLFYNRDLENISKLYIAQKKQNSIAKNLVSHCLMQDLEKSLLNNYKLPAVYVNNKPFTGMVDINPNWEIENWKGIKRDKETPEFTYTQFGFHGNDYMGIYSDFNHNYSDHFDSDKFPYTKMQINCDSGKILKFTKGIIATFANQQLQYLEIPLTNDGRIINTYRNGILNGNQYAKNFKLYKTTRLMCGSYVPESIIDVSYTNHAATIPIINNKIHGHIHATSETNTVRIPFTNDTLQGYITIQKHDILIRNKGEINTFFYDYFSDSLSFQDGLLHGKTVSYNAIYEPTADFNYLHNNSEKSIQSILPKKAEFYFDKGVQVGTQKYYYSSGVLSTTIEMTHADNNTKGEFVANQETVFFNWTKGTTDLIHSKKATIPEFNWGLKINKNAQEFKINPLTDFYKYNSRENGYHTVYYNNGMVQQKGKVKDNKRIGFWEYYTENGKLYKSINYYDSALKTIYLDDTIIARGYVVNYDKYGNKINEGFITDQDFYGACVSMEEISIEEISYTKVYNNNQEYEMNKNSIVPIFEYQISGNKRFDGYIVGGKKDSVWKIYSANGSLKSIGKYKAGNKEGRWISGDLTGINLQDNVCFDPRDYLRIKENMTNIYISETLYKKGEIISKMETQLNTTGVSKESIDDTDLFFMQESSKLLRKKIILKRKRDTEIEKDILYLIDSAIIKNRLETR